MKEKGCDQLEKQSVSSALSTMPCPFHILYVCVVVSSTLYWTYRDGHSSFGQSLQYMHLSDINNIVTIPLDGRGIRSLTFEPYSKSLYWITRSSRSSDSIERFELSSGNISTVAENAGEVQGVLLIKGCFPGGVLN